MSSPNVCLILGAGASKPYGYPLRWQLKERIIQYCLSKPRDCAPRELIPKTHEILEIFAQRFDRDGSSTVDAFLTKLVSLGDQELVNHGRMAIVAVLSTYERAYDETPGWYDQIPPLLAAQINSSPLLRVVTFNYDRSLEFLLSRSLEKAQVARHLAREGFKRSIEVIHIYGCFADLPVFSRNPATALEYGEITGHGKWKGGLERIKLVGEGLPDDKDIRTCKQWIATAEYVIVLGFAFDHTNLNLIGLDGLSAGKFLFCSGFKLNGEIRSRVRWSCTPAKIHFGHEDTISQPFSNDPGCCLQPLGESRLSGCMRGLAPEFHRNSLVDLSVC